MELRHIRWEGEHTPGESLLRRHLESEGFEVRRWRDPADRTYEAHSHVLDESLWVIRGQIELEVDGRHFPLGPGDRIELPRGTVHRARAGPDGAVYLIGQRLGVA
jgi:quercetin dioxygenase-like cupin family protein